MHKNEIREQIQQLLLWFSDLLGQIIKWVVVTIFGEETYLQLSYMRVKKIIWNLCYYILPLLVGILIFLIGTEDFALQVGTRSMNLFVIILLASPLSRLFPKIKLFRYIMWLRRELWVLIFWLVVLHSLYFMVDHNILSWERLKQVWYRDDYYSRWFLATAGMMILGVTSNTKSLLVLKKRWKRIHYIVYPVMIFAILHTVLAGDEWTKYILLGIIWLFLKWYLYYQKKQKLL